VLTDTKWHDYYHITDRIINAAVLWKPKSYIAGTMMTLSFQYKKHCPIGKGGAILLDNKEQYQLLHRLVADGRDRHKLQINDNVSMFGYHYFMTPEDAARGLKIFDYVKHIDVERKGWQNYRDLRTFDCFRQWAK
jgi:dTDP-4-amino-4,6-dideoxygalactose transaminase